MGDSDYGAAMPEALEKPPPPPSPPAERQALPSPADNNKLDNDRDNIEPSKTNGEDEQLASSDLSSNSTAEANNNLNSDDQLEDPSKSNGDVMVADEPRPSHDDSTDRQSDLDLRLHDSSESFMELDEVSSDAAVAAPTKSTDQETSAEAQLSSDGSQDNAVTKESPLEHLEADSEPTASTEAEGKEESTERPAAEVSVTDGSLVTDAPVVVDIDSPSTQQQEQQQQQSKVEPSVSPAKGDGGGASATVATSASAVVHPSSATGSSPRNRSTSPEIGEGEATPSEDVVTIVVMEKDDEEEPSEEEGAGQDLPPGTDAGTGTPEECDDSGEAGASGEPAVKLVTTEGDQGVEISSGNLKQEPEGRMDNEATPTAATAPVDSDSNSREAEQAESSFLILGSDHSSGESGSEESSRTKENGEVGNTAAERVPSSSGTGQTKASGNAQTSGKVHPSPEEMNDERFAEIESLVAAFDRPEDEGNEGGQPGSSQAGRVRKESAAGAHIPSMVVQGKVQKKRGRKSKEEKERLARLAETLTSAEAAETSDESKNRAVKAEKWASGLRVKSEKITENKQRRSAMVATDDTVELIEVTEQKVQKARRTGGAPTKKEPQRPDSAAGGSTFELAIATDVVAGNSQKEVPSVVGNGKLRVHGYERVHPQTGLPELVTVNREALEKVISEQNSQMQRMKAKLKEMYKVCDDLRKVVLTKGLQEAVLTPEEAAIPVDVTIRMAKLPPKGLQTSHVSMAQGEPAAVAAAKMKAPKTVVKRGGPADTDVAVAVKSEAAAAAAAASAAVAASASHAIVPGKVSHLGKLQQGTKGDAAKLAKVAKQVDEVALAKFAHCHVIIKVAPVSSSSDGGDGGSGNGDDPTARPVAHKPDRSDDVDDSLIEQTRNLVDALPKDIVRALTNGDVLTAQQRQRFIDKITMDIMKAKGVPQPKQIQEIALQVANMYPRSLVILPEGKRKSNLRRKRGETDDGDADDTSELQSAAKKPRISQGAALLSTQSSSAGSVNQAANAGKTPVKVATTSLSADGTPAPKRRGRPPKNPQETSATSHPSQSQSSPAASSARKVNGGVTSPGGGGITTPVAKKRGRPKKEVATPPAGAQPAAVAGAPTVASAEELSMTPDEQKAWLREDLQRPAKEQDRAKQERLLHNCYNLLYGEMAENNYDAKYITSQWPALREPNHVLSIFKRLKKVHGEFQEHMRRDAPKLVTFLHERVTTEEGAEWSLAISQAKPGPRYHLPEEVGVMPLLALNFDEDFNLLFKLVPDEAALQTVLPQLAVSQPMIIGVGSSIFSCEYRVIVERQEFFSSPPTTFLDALEWVYAAYFVFNFAYPRELSNTLEYVQRYYVGYNPHIKMVTLANSRPKIANFLKKLKDFERLDWNANNIRANSPGVPSDFERESDSEEAEELGDPETMNMDTEIAHKASTDGNEEEATGDSHNGQDRLQAEVQLVDQEARNQPVPTGHEADPSTSAPQDEATGSTTASNTGVTQTSPSVPSSFQLS